MSPDEGGGLSVGDRFRHLEDRMTDLEDWAHHGPDSVDQWRSGLRGAFALLKYAFGASIVSGVLGTIALVQLLMQASGATP